MDGFNSETGIVDYVKIKRMEIVWGRWLGKRVNAWQGEMQWKDIAKMRCLSGSQFAR